MVALLLFLSSTLVCVQENQDLPPKIYHTQHQIVCEDLGEFDRIVPYEGQCSICEEYSPELWIWYNGPKKYAHDGCVSVIGKCDIAAVNHVDNLMAELRSASQEFRKRHEVEIYMNTKAYMRYKVTQECRALGYTLKIAHEKLGQRELTRMFNDTGIKEATACFRDLFMALVQHPAGVEPSR